jgi:hypothetical protein
MTAGLSDQPLLDGNNSGTNYWKLLHPSGVPKWDAIEQTFGGRYQHEHIRAVQAQRSILTDPLIRIESRQLASDMLDFIIMWPVSHSCFAPMFAVYSGLLLFAGVIGWVILKCLPIAIGGLVSGVFFTVLSLTYFVRERKRKNGIEESRTREVNLRQVGEASGMVSWSPAPTPMSLPSETSWISHTGTSSLQ